MDDKRIKSLCAKLAKVVALNVRECRTTAQLTQKQLAEKMGCLIPVVSRLESGRGLPSLTTIVKAADALKVPPCRLIEEPET